MSLDREDWDYGAIWERLPESDHSEYGARDSWMIFGKRIELDCWLSHLCVKRLSLLPCETINPIQKLMYDSIGSVL